MYSRDIVINCPYCEVDLRVNPLNRSMQCPYCDKLFQVEEGKKAREIMVQRKNMIEESRNELIRSQDEAENIEIKRVKYCTECGRKLAYDARFCDWCGTKVHK